MVLGVVLEVLEVVLKVLESPRLACLKGAPLQGPHNTELAWYPYNTELLRFGVQLATLLYRDLLYKDLLYKDLLYKALLYKQLPSKELLYKELP